MAAPRDTGAGRATVTGLVAAAVLMLGIYFGSARLRHFDTALVSYAAASVFSAFGIGFRYSVWLQRPPTRRYWARGWQLFLRPRDLPGNLLRLARVYWDSFIAQTFIERRSLRRWAAHAGIFWGCMLAAAVTFPLSFGWIHFQTPRDTQTLYDAYLFDIRVLRFPLSSPLAPLVFNVLVISAALVLAGVFLALWRRARDRGAMAVQQFADDLFPLVLLFAISVTGLLLTVSARWLHGFHYVFLSQLHAVIVILTLLYLPFGKFFHIFQRPAQLSIAFYKRAGARGEQTRCVRCNAPFASALHVGDLKTVQAELGIRYRMASGVHYQDVCPSCRRKNLAVLQDGLWRAARDGAREMG